MLRRPPALAVWLLDRLGYTRQNAALAGDLLEEFRNGRSAGWYWRQTLAVIADSFPQHLASLAPYLLAVSAGYAVQFPLSYALWSLGFPREVTGSGWAKAGLWALMQAAAWFAVAAPVKWTLGQWSSRVRPMFFSAGSDRQKRARILALAWYESFSFGFWCYCLCGVVFWRFSQAEFLKYESTWFVLWVFAPAVLSALAAPTTRASEPVEDREPWLAIPQREPVITVALPDGRAILLERDRLAESTFAAGDPELIRVAFGRGKSLDLLRRAIWLGGYRSRSYIQRRAESFTLAEFAALIDETARTKSVIEAWWCKTNRRESFRLRLKVWFCGDYARSDGVR
jgi:hypothetical protein